jgi:hypothetical protein
MKEFLKVSDQKTVQSAFVRFYGLLYELKLSPQTNEAIAVLETKTIVAVISR